MIQSNSIFVLSNLDIRGELPLRINNDFMLRRADDIELRELELYLERSGQKWLSRDPLIKYRAVVREETSAGHTKYIHEPQPKENWRFWVVAFDEVSPKGHVIFNKTQNILTTGLLLPVEVELGMSFFFEIRPDAPKQIRGIAGIPTQLLERQIFGKEIRRNWHVTTIGELGLWTEYDALYNALPKEAEYVRRAMQSFEQLRMIPISSDLLVLGYFAIIESLVTHPPRSAETLDSINHQIVNKLILLGKRFRNKVLLSDYFLASSDETLWKLLYKYRSQIAHGGEAEFERTFQSLKSRDMVRDFLKEVVRQLLVFGLKEHEFLNDLKRC